MDGMPGRSSESMTNEIDLLLRKSKIVREDDPLSIRAQEDRGRRWAEQNGYTVRKIWRENLSAWSDVKRPEYDAAMAAVLDGEVPALWCYALDRFSRKGAESVIPILGKARVIFDYEDLDSSRERDRRWIIQRAEDAREYSQRLSYNVATTKERQRAEGKWLSAAPFGLVADPVTRKLSPGEHWGAVERLFEAIAGGESSRSMARTLTAKGVASPGGGPWRPNTIRWIIRNPAYEGWMAVRIGSKVVPYLTPSGERVRCVAEDVIPLMVDPGLAQRARNALSGNALWDSSPVGRPSALLTGRVRCAGCRGAMTLQGRSYRCSRDIGGTYCPDPASAYRPALERYVTAEWLRRMGESAPEDPVMLAVAERWAALTRPTETEELRSAREALREAEAALERFHSDDRAGFYEGRSAKFRLPAKRAAEAALDTAEERLSELGGGGAVDVTFLLEGNADAFWESAGDSLRRELIGVAVDRITVCSAGGGGGGHRPFVGAERVSLAWATEGSESDA